MVKGSKGDSSNDPKVTWSFFSNQFYSPKTISISNYNQLPIWIQVSTDSSTTLEEDDPKGV